VWFGLMEQQLCDHDARRGNRDRPDYCSELMNVDDALGLKRLSGLSRRSAMRYLPVSRRNS